MEVVPSRGERARARRRIGRRRAAFVGCVLAATSVSLAAAGAAQPEQPHGDGDPVPGIEGWGKVGQQQSSSATDVGAWAADGSGVRTSSRIRPGSAGDPGGLDARPFRSVCVVVLGKAYDVATVGELLSAMRTEPSEDDRATPPLSAPLRTPVRAGPCTGSEDADVGHGSEVGKASWYYAGDRGTWNQGLTAASPWLPYGTEVTVTNLDSGASVTVVITDRGPFGGRSIDLSETAFSRIAPIGQGVAPVRLTW